MNFLTTLLSGTNSGLTWALLAIGVFVSYRVLDFADLTIEGSVTTGAATVIVLTNSGCPAIISTLIAALAGALAGIVTGLLHTKLKIPPILAGILTMTALYSLNYLIMGSSAMVTGNDEIPTIFGGSDGVFGVTNNSLKPLVYFGILTLICAVFGTALYFFFGTEIGAQIRATGINEKMCRAQGINTDNKKIYGLAISNALVALTGAIYAQKVGNAPLALGVGTIVMGLAAVIIGETIFFHPKSFAWKLVATLVGCVLYQIITAFAMQIPGFTSEYLKLIVAIIVAIALSVPTLKTYFAKIVARKKRERSRLSLATNVNVPINDLSISESTNNSTNSTPIMNTVVPTNEIPITNASDTVNEIPSMDTTTSTERMSVTKSKKTIKKTREDK